MIAENTVFTRTFSEIPVSKKEILRYAGAGSITPEITLLLDECLKASQGCFSYQVCYRLFPLTFGETLDLGFAETSSRSLRKNLQGCDKILLFAATVGLGIDRLIARYSTLSPAKALLFQAIGAERIESLCDIFCADFEKELASEGRFAKPRFSPGYGDLPLSLQRNIFRALEPPRRIGVSLNESLLMTPSKSVTAIIGIATKGAAHEHS